MREKYKMCSIISQVLVTRIEQHFLNATRKAILVRRVNLTANGYEKKAPPTTRCLTNNELFAHSFSIQLSYVWAS